jgi:hypothetical protein
MNRHFAKPFNSSFAAACLVVLGSLLAAAPAAYATLIVDDSWADGGRNNGADPLDANWWSSVSSAGTGIEVSVGSLGMVTGTSGRGIHGIFPTQTLANVGDSLVATYTFTTPATISSTAQTGGFRVGLFDTLGRGGLDADITSSSGSPNSLYGLYSAATVGLPGYMMDMDVATGAEDISFRQLDTPVNVGAQTPTGRLMGTTTGFTQLSPTGVDGGYTFAANTTYTGTFTITRINTTDMQLTGTLGSYSHTNTDTFDSANIGMLAFWANSNVFGSSSTSNTADNGIDFSNIKIEVIPVPEPAALSMFGMAAMLLGCRTWRRGGR